jgi:hypothetical protein
VLAHLISQMLALSRPARRRRDPYVGAKLVHKRP